MPLAPLVRRVRHGMTLGVRVIAIDSEDRVLLVRHTYAPGWHLPGGGVDIGESAEEAARRELREETRAEITGPLTLHGFFFNAAVGGRDYVACYRAGDVQLNPLPGPTYEIAEVAACPLHALPADTTPATRRRIAEAVNGDVPGDCW
ncbi:NUDIX hydrolase [Azorhizobium oxalatiphilum]|uniref:NUDIX hydrolase n=1 Tax=Azorhizobium oxalatiphilum TaxID=980631 RepID=A0A917C1D7_9HYPH|nr:NUDIX domain-containing protein [Azorhizobium oxalatiphilum]GGF65908.1 NUDIX hydrolase [Azorhizobium oxalatiphilum]